MAAGAREDFLQVKLSLVQSGATSSAQPICSGGCLLMTLIMTLSEQSSCARVCPLTDQSGQRSILAGAGLSANDPTATLAVHCGNGFDASFSPYRSTRLSR